MDIVIMDLDGVLCDNSHRAHLVPPADQQHRNEAWQPFVAECANDAPIAAGVAMLRMVSRDYPVVVVTSRQEIFYHETYAWCRKHLPKVPETIFRRADDHSSPADYKRSVLERLRRYGHTIAFAIDDDPAIVAMYNAEGVPTFQPSTRCSSCK